MDTDNFGRRATAFFLANPDLLALGPHDALLVSVTLCSLVVSFLVGEHEVFLTVGPEDMLMDNDVVRRRPTGSGFGVSGGLSQVEPAVLSVREALGTYVVRGHAVCLFGGEGELRVARMSGRRVCVQQHCRRVCVQQHCVGVGRLGVVFFFVDGDFFKVAAPVWSVGPSLTNGTIRWTLMSLFGASDDDFKLGRSGLFDMNLDNLRFFGAGE